MGKVRTGHSTSLDGFIAGPNDGPEAPMGHGGERLLGWPPPATPNTGCLVPRWCSRSRRRLPSYFARRKGRQERW